MRIHHLNCGTLTPPGESMVCHVLPLEVGRHLVLVDTGFGSVDVRAPSRLGPVRHPRGPQEAQRYRPSQWAHGPRITPHRPRAVRWKGFEGCVDLSAVAPGMLLVPMPGHTAGHAGVAIPTGSGWLLHAGDAFHSALTLRKGPSRLDVRVRQELPAHDEPALRRTQRRLGALARREPAVRIVNSHDRKLWEQA